MRSTHEAGRVRLQIALASSALLLGFVGASSPARAQVEGTSATRAMVVQTDGDLFVLDIGGQAAEVGLELDVYRTIEVRHPVTRRVMRDRFVIGRVRVEQVSSTLSMARALGTPLRPIGVGDAVEREHLEAAPPAGAIATSAERDCPSEAGACPACAPGAEPGDPETREIVAVWRASLGRSPEERIRLYGIYLRRNPRSAHMPYLHAEIAAMGLLRARPEPGEGLDAGSGSASRGVSGERLVRVREGHPADIALAVAPGLGVRALLLHVRRRTGGFRTVGMRIDAAGQAVARIPQALVRVPSFEYFVEAVGSEGRTMPAVARADAPARVTVVRDAGIQPAVEQERSRVRVSTELASFDGFTGRDWYVIAEADFLYRVLLYKLYSVRVGYGVYRGEGGPISSLDDPLDPHSDAAGFTYGYVETEIRLFELFSLIPRISVGLGRPDEGEGQSDGLRAGFQLRARIGRERGVHLVLAAETIPEIGERAFIGLAAELVERLPMALEVHVTDQPADADELGVRLVYEIGIRPVETFTVAARLSYQGRTIDHTGVGAGLAATFDW